MYQRYQAELLFCVNCFTVGIHLNYYYIASSAEFSEVNYRTGQIMSPFAVLLVITLGYSHTYLNTQRSEIGGRPYNNDPTRKKHYLEHWAYACNIICNKTFIKYNRPIHIKTYMFIRK
jgi:hypothetical protein